MHNTNLFTIILIQNLQNLNRDNARLVIQQSIFLRISVLFGEYNVDTTNLESANFRSYT